LLPGRLPDARGYLGGEDFIDYEDNKAYFRRKWTSDFLLRDNDSVCNDLAVILVIGGVEKNPGPGVEAENIVQVVCSGCDRNLKPELHVTCVDAGSVTAVVINGS